MITIATCATENYCYALPALFRRVQANIITAGLEQDEVRVVLVGDGSEKFQAAAKFGAGLFFDQFDTIEHPCWVEGENYKNPVQLVISQMRACAVDYARAHDSDYLWFLDSDVLAPDNALACSLQMLDFDNGYYHVAACPYPSQGGGSFLCGNGSPANPIAEDFTIEESGAPEYKIARFKKLVDFRNKFATEGKHEKADKANSLAVKMQERIKAHGPKGNVFSMNAEKWRRRGWFDMAYPAIGKGAVVPSDWCGFGCTLLGRKALAACDWSGYAGDGTEDLFVVWHPWLQQDIRIVAIPHCPCSHVVRARDDKTRYVMVEAYHEPEGEFRGHLRQRTRPWYNHTPGEVYEKRNNGLIFQPSTAQKPVDG